ncbi:MAG: hypothetical protein SH850_20280 [Planctomycetaceae bacterium]|nr:hypothetical protein [Planctomycetaceae bacterium]
MATTLCKSHVEALRQKVGKWPSLSGDEKDELVSGALEALAVRLNRGEDIELVDHWLLAAASNIRKKLIHESAVRHTVESVVEAGVLENSQERPSCTANNQLQNVVECSLRSLGYPQREMVMRCFMHDVSPADAARELSINYSTALSSLKRGRLRLSQDKNLQRAVVQKRVIDEEHHHAS